jgi:hypothetical protein
MRPRRPNEPIKETVGVMNEVVSAAGDESADGWSTRKVKRDQGADVEREMRELASQPRTELNDLALIYVNCGLDKELAMRVAEQLSTRDRLGAHLGDELRIDRASLAPRCKRRGYRPRALRPLPWCRLPRLSSHPRLRASPRSLRCLS